MKNKQVSRLFLIITFIAGFAFSIALKAIKNEYINPKADFTAVVTEVNDKSILVTVNEDEDEIKSSDKIDVSLDAESKDSIKDFKVGDKVKIIYDGSILETYPAKIRKVYSISLVN